MCRASSREASTNWGSMWWCSLISTHCPAQNAFPEWSAGHYGRWQAGLYLLPSKKSPCPSLFFMSLLPVSRVQSNSSSNNKNKKEKKQNKNSRETFKAVPLAFSDLTLSTDESTPPAASPRLASLPKCPQLFLSIYASTSLLGPLCLPSPVHSEKKQT